MERHLRTLQRTVLVGRKGQYGTSRAIFVVTVAALLYHFFMGGNVIRVILGFEPNIRFNPANILMLLVALYVLARGPVPFHKLCRQSPGLVIYFCTIPLFMIYTASFNGFSGAAFYFDSFWAPAFLAVAMECVNDRQQRALGKFLLVIVLLNAAFGLVENVTHTNLFPFVNEDALDAEQVAKQLEITDDFRANAFYTHPLTASLVTAMGLFMAFAMRLPFWAMGPTVVLVFLGLLAFGGRTALVVATATTCLIAGWIVLSGLARRTLKLRTVTYMALAAIVLPLLIGYVMTQTTIADRIIDTFYMDDSAEVRIIQWRVLGYMSLKNWLFGLPAQDLLALKYQIGITGVEDIENFWLLIFLNLGTIGFLTFLLVFGVFLAHIAKYGGGLYGWVLMLTGLIIDSGSNSLGTKSNDLVIEVAMLMAMAGYRHYQPLGRLRSAPRWSGMVRQIGHSGVLAAMPVAPSRGLSVRPSLQPPVGKQGAISGPRPLWGR